MIRRQFLTWCVLATLPVAGSRPRTAAAQQPQAPARARVRTAPVTPAGQETGAGTQPRVARPAANSIEEQPLSPELEELLQIWERESAKIKRLNGGIKRFTYDRVYFVEKRALGEFWYQSPDQGRIDFGPTNLTSDSDKKGQKGEQYQVQQEGHQRWICNGQMIYLIDDDSKTAEQVQIPAHQQGKNIVNGPLPFLFGMKAEYAKQRYHLALGSMHAPRGVIRQPDGTETRAARQIHVLAAPKYQVDAAEWCRAEVLLDPVRFVPTAIRLLNPQKTQETVYMFNEMKTNGVWLLNNPFNDKPPSSYTISQPTRATTDDTPVAPPK